MSSRVRSGRLSKLRIPFEIAISDPNLLKVPFEKLSRPQQTALKIFYGLKLDAEELDYWAMFNEEVEYDFLGYPTAYGSVPYEPREYEIATAILGRRSGKTASFSAFIVAYEATCGGHEEFVAKRQKPLCALVAQDQRLARENMPLILGIIDDSPTLKAMLVDSNADFITFNNGMKIGVLPANLKSLRGYAIPVIAGDEVGFWYTDSESANPDIEVERAVAKAQGQFPFRKRVWTSTPWLKAGILWRESQAGTRGRKLPEGKRKRFERHLVLHATTPGMQNPLLDREWFEAEYHDDPDAYEREILARFPNSISGFLNEMAVKEAGNTGFGERPFMKAAPGEMQIVHIAAMDPAFRKDWFTFTIVHNGPEGIVQDFVKRWQGEPGKPVNPGEVLDEIKEVLDLYHVRTVYSDQYQLESLQQLALDRGFSIEGVDFTNKSKAKIFGSLQTSLNTKKIKLLDPSVNPVAAEQEKELLKLEKRILQGGNVQIAAPPGKHDDLACMLALACFKSLWMQPSVMQKAQPKEKTLAQKCWDQIKRRRVAAQRFAQGDWD